MRADERLFDYAYDSGEEWCEEPEGDAVDAAGSDGEEDDACSGDDDGWLVNDDVRHCVCVCVCFLRSHCACRFRTFITTPRHCVTAWRPLRVMLMPRPAAPPPPTPTHEPVRGCAAAR